MLDNFSLRSKRVIFGTRVKAGRRGAEALDVGDLIFAIILEDQEMIRELTGHEGNEEIGHPAGLKPHTPFLSKSSASNLLAALEPMLSRKNPIPDSVDMTITANLGRIFESAEGKREEFHHKQVEPLHLLAAVLELPSRQEADLLRRAGIDEENVRAKLKEL